MDSYTKFVLTVIAVALTVIAIRPFALSEAKAGVFAGGPTVGDLMATRSIKDPKTRDAERTRINQSMPLVFVSGGNISVSGSVEVDR